MYTSTWQSSKIHTTGYWAEISLIVEKREYKQNLTEKQQSFDLKIETWMASITCKNQRFLSSPDTRYTSRHFNCT